MLCVLEYFILIATQEAASFHSVEPGGREVQCQNLEPGPQRETPAERVFTVGFQDREEVGRGGSELRGCGQGSERECASPPAPLGSEPRLHPCCGSPFLSILLVPGHPVLPPSGPRGPAF